VDAQQLLITFGGEGGAGLKPFALVDSGNVKFVPAVAAASVLEVELRFILDGSATSGVYNLPVTLAYEAADGKSHNETQVINLMASRRPQFQVSFYRKMEPGVVSEPLTLPIEIVNIGRNQVNVSTLEIAADGLDITNGSVFIGSLDGGTSGTLDAEGIPTAPGTLPVQVIVHYLDDFNQPQVYTHSLSVEVLELESTPVPQAEQPTQVEESSGPMQEVLRFLRAFFGLGS
jgi:hypothetical protein